MTRHLDDMQPSATDKTTPPRAALLVCRDGTEILESATSRHMREISSRVVPYSKEVHDFGKHDERAWRVLHHPARRVLHREHGTITTNALGRGTSSCGPGRLSPTPP